MITLAGFAQWLKGVPTWAWGVLLVGLGLWLSREDAKADTENKIEIKSLKTARKVIAKQKDEANERLKEIEDAGAKAVKDMPDGDDVDYADSVPDDLAEFIFGDRRDG